MSVTVKEITTLARLSKLDFDDEKCKSFLGEFDEIIAFANTINDAVVGDTESLKEVGGNEIALENLREDVVCESLPNEKIVSNVEAEGGFFPVKRVVK
ncbi:MAG: aspartyl/glutamyl-tRNA amidotransferase subunit C [Clostridia bacterium]|nr:aspartyl/glutamyl-tRNA amidotransferase subunit C [Clostridia bacterium]